VTAGPTENASAAATQAKGEAAARQHETAAQAQHSASGSEVVIEDARTPDDVSVQWSTTDNAASPSLQPSTPSPVNSADRSPTDPT
jgi:hypothetical protein